jgi:flagellar protein FliO/FliZ
MKNAVRFGALLAGLHGLAARAALPTVPTAATPPPAAAGGLLQAGFGLLVVLALVFACAWVVKRLGLPMAGGGDRIIKVVATAAIGHRERVVVVQVGGEWLVLGVASGQVRHLHTMAAGAAAPPSGSSAAAAPSGFDAAAFAHKLRASLAQLKGRS